MARFAVRVREILARTIIVEGVDSYEEAVKCVWDAIEEDRLNLDIDDYDDREVEPSQYFSSKEIPDDVDVSYYWHLD